MEINEKLLNRDISEDFKELGTISTIADLFEKWKESITLENPEYADILKKLMLIHEDNWNLLKSSKNSQ